MTPQFKTVTKRVKSPDASANGAALRKYRDDAGLRLIELAAHMGISKSRVQQFESDPVRPANEQQFNQYISAVDALKGKQ